MEYDPEAHIEGDALAMVSAANIEKLFCDIACLYQKQQNEKRWCKVRIGEMEIVYCCVSKRSKLFMRSIPVSVIIYHCDHSGVVIWQLLLVLGWQVVY